VELAVALLALPRRDEVEHMHALVALPVLLALLAAELDAPSHKERAAGRRVAHLDEARVEVDLGRERGDGDERRRADAQDRRDRLVEEALVAVGGLLEDEHVAAGALGGPDLHRERESVAPEAPSALLYTLARASTFWVANCGRARIFKVK
jgi:hypothetical protein